jgi:hypothetical protein
MVDGLLRKFLITLDGIVAKFFLSKIRNCLHELCVTGILIYPQ